MYTTINIPKKDQINDISKIHILKSESLPEYSHLFKINKDFKPIQVGKPNKTQNITDIMDLSHSYVNTAQDYNSNLILIEKEFDSYIQCKEIKSEGTIVPGVGVGAIVVDQYGKYLLTKRGPLAGNCVGEWENPGGTQEVGETLSETAERETLEETGYYVKAIGIVSVSEEFKEGQHWNNFGILCQWYGQKNPNFKPEVGKIDEIEFKDFNNLPEKISQGSLAIIKDHRTGLQIPINHVYK